MVGKWGPWHGGLKTDVSRPKARIQHMLDVWPWASHLVCEPRELIQSYLATISSRIRRPCIKAHRVIDLKRICILLESQDFIMEYLLANLYARTSSVCFIALVLAGKGLTKQSGVSCPLLGFYFFLIFIWKSFPTYRKLQEKKKKPSNSTNHLTYPLPRFTYCWVDSISE